MKKAVPQNLKLDTPEEIAQAMLHDPIYYDKIKRRYWRLIDSGHSLSAGHADWVFTYLFQAYFKHFNLPVPLFTATPVSEILLEHMQRLDSERN